MNRAKKRPAPATGPAAPAPAAADEPARGASSLSALVERELARPPGAEGADISILGELEEHGFEREELFQLVVPRRTFMRRASSGGPLSPGETDRAVRLARIAALAERVFGAEDKARRWLRRESRSLGGAEPLSLLKTERGALLVEQVLHRIDHGMLA